MTENPESLWNPGPEVSLNKILRSYGFWQDMPPHTFALPDIDLSDSEANTKAALNYIKNRYGKLGE